MPVDDAGKGNATNVDGDARGAVTRLDRLSMTRCWFICQIASGLLGLQQQSMRHREGGTRR
jgi:hypothetical protein